MLLVYSRKNICLEYCAPTVIPHTRVLDRSCISFSLASIAEPPCTEAALFPLTHLIPTEGYQEVVVLSLPLIRKLAAKAIQKAQRRYKTQHDHKSTKRKY